MLAPLPDDEPNLMETAFNERCTGDEDASPLSTGAFLFRWIDRYRVDLNVISIISLLKKFEMGKFNDIFFVQELPLSSIFSSSTSQELYSSIGLWQEWAMRAEYPLNLHLCSTILTCLHHRLLHKHWNSPVIFANQVRRRNSSPRRTWDTNEFRGVRVWRQLGWPMCFGRKPRKFKPQSVPPYFSTSYPSVASDALAELYPGIGGQLASNWDMFTLRRMQKWELMRRSACGDRSVSGVWSQPKELEANWRRICSCVYLIPLAIEVVTKNKIQEAVWWKEILPISTSSDIAKCPELYPCLSIFSLKQGGLTATTMIYFIDSQLAKTYMSFLHIWHSAPRRSHFLIEGLYVVGRKCHGRLTDRGVKESCKSLCGRQQARQRHFFWSGEKIQPRPSSVSWFSVFREESLL